MSAAGLYTDHHVPRAIVEGLRLRGVDVVTAADDGAEQLDDENLLDRARETGRVLFTMDDDLLRIAAERQRAGIPSAGVVYGHQLRVSIGQCVRDLQLIVEATEPGELDGSVLFLPL